MDEIVQRPFRPRSTLKSLMNRMGVSTKMSVDSAKAGICYVTYWPPQAQGLTRQAVKQTAPITPILPEPNSGEGLSKVRVRIWDAEGNRSAIHRFRHCAPPLFRKWERLRSTRGL
jgi:hypothetical protein